MRKLVLLWVALLAVLILTCAEPALADTPTFDTAHPLSTISEPNAGSPAGNNANSTTAISRTGSDTMAAPANGLSSTSGLAVLDSPRNLAPALPRLDEFVSTVKTGEKGAVLGVYVPQTMALKVVQQPAGNPVFVSENPTDITQFGFATQYGSTGLIAHNFLAGANFFKLSIGQEVDIVYGAGNVRRYLVSKIRRLQALRPMDPYSPFIDLDNGGQQLSSTDVFKQMYQVNDQVVLQTCIDNQGISSWGRLFVIASPIP
jgi:hypothetical protein